VLVLSPVSATRDDDISMVAFLLDSDPCDDAISSGPHLSSGNHDGDGADRFWRFDEVDVSPICVVDVESSFAFLSSTIVHTHKGPSLPALAGRAPPAV